MQSRVNSFRVRPVSALVMLPLLIIAGVRSAGAQPSVGPTIVSIQERDMLARDAYAAVAKQANITLTYDFYPPDDSRRVSLRLIHEPFWEAMKRIGEVSGMSVGAIGRESGPKIAMLPSDFVPGNVPVADAVSGLFLGTMCDAVESANRGKTAAPTSRIASKLTIFLRAEPKVKAMMWYGLNVDQFVDENGRTIPQRLSIKTGVFSHGFCSVQLEVPERPWPRKVGRMRLSGKVLLAQKTETAQITDLMNDNPLTVYAGGFRIDTRARNASSGEPEPLNISKANASKSGRRVTLELTRVGSYGPEWLQPSRLDLLEPMIFDKRGMRVTTSVRDRDWFGKMCRIELETAPVRVRTGEPIGDPHKLLMEIPTDVVEQEVKLEFNDVALR